MTLRETFICVIVSVLLASGQILFKYSSLASENGNQPFIYSLFSPRFIFALFVYALATVLWVYVLRTAPLSRAYPIAIMGAALIPVASHFMFGEPVGWRYMIGFTTLIIGLIIISTD